MKRGLTFLEVGGEGELEDGAGRVAGESQRSTVRLGAGPGDRQAEPGSLLRRATHPAARRVAPEEPGEPDTTQPLYQPGVPVYEGYTQTLQALNGLPRTGVVDAGLAGSSLGT